MLIVMCLFLTLPAAAGWALNVNPEVSNDGVFRLHWDGPEAIASVEESPVADFAGAHEVYAGTDRATVISGQPNGVYHYRLRDADGAVVARASVRVEHHSLARAWTFFLIGLVVFLATVVLVVRGSKETV